MQLSLFPTYEDDVLTDKANALLAALNEDRKKNEIYRPFAWYQEDGLIVLIAQNKGNILCNILDLNGRTPNGFSACWIHPNHIKRELGL